MDEAINNSSNINDEDQYYTREELDEFQKRLRSVPSICMLFAGLVVAIFMRVQGYDNRTWLTILFFTMVFFLILGIMLERTIKKFTEANFAKMEEMRITIIKEQEEAEFGESGENNEQIPEDLESGEEIPEGENLGEDDAA